MFIGAKIKEIRMSKKLTKANMAEKLDISIQAYTKIENDATDINFSRLEQIATVYNMNVADLVGFGEKASYHHSTHTGHNASVVNYGDNELNIQEKYKSLEIKIAVLEERLNTKDNAIAQLNKLIEVLQK